MKEEENDASDGDSGAISNTKMNRRTFMKANMAAAATASALIVGMKTDFGKQPLLASSTTQQDTSGNVPVESQTVTLNINGNNYTFSAQAREQLVNVLRDRIGLLGTKRPCNRSECGGCTVVVDGRAVLSCTALVVELQGSKITTIEGLAQNGTPHPVQQAFATNFGYQCGHCTSGQIMSAYALLTSNPNPTDDQILNAMSSNLCKCAAYPNILKSVKAAVQLMSGGS